MVFQKTGLGHTIVEEDRRMSGDWMQGKKAAGRPDKSGDRWIAFECEDEQ
jgi:hypothetical protein